MPALSVRPAAAHHGGGLAEGAARLIRCWIPVLEKYHDHILNVHLKGGTTDGMQPSLEVRLDADQGSPLVDAEGEVDLPGEHRTGVQDSRGLGRCEGSRQVLPALQSGARLSRVSLSRALKNYIVA